MLAAGGFTLTAAVHIFNIKRLHSIIRPTILTAFLGYVLVCAALMFDLGKPYNIWHPLIMRNPHSVMFEVAYCVMLYTTVLALEFSPIVLERFKMEKPLKIVGSDSDSTRDLRRHSFDAASVVARHVCISSCRRSCIRSGTARCCRCFSFSRRLPSGLAMTIFESSMSSKHFGLQLELASPAGARPRAGGRARRLRNSSF